MKDLQEIEHLKSTSKILLVISFIILIFGLIMNNSSLAVLSWGLLYYAYGVQRRVIKFYEKDKT